MWEYAKVKNGVQKLRMRGTGLLIQLSSPGAEIPCRLCVLGRRNAGNDTSLVKTSSNFLPIRRRESKKWDCTSQIRKVRWSQLSANW